MAPAPTSHNGRRQLRFRAPLTAIPAPPETRQLGLQRLDLLILHAVFVSFLKIFTDEDGKFVQPVVVQQCDVPGKAPLAEIEKITRVAVVEIVSHPVWIRITGQQIECEAMFADGGNPVESRYDVLLPLRGGGMLFYIEYTTRHCVIHSRNTIPSTQESRRNTLGAQLAGPAPP
jgi:hypothetical protein